MIISVQNIIRQVKWCNLTFDGQITAEAFIIFIANVNNLFYGKIVNVL